jgi:hypothetical protein
VYEPIEALPEAARADIDAQAAGRRASTLSTEQRLSLTRVVIPPALPVDVKPDGATYVLRRDGAEFFCPVDLSLRSWLSLTSLVETMGDAAVGMIIPNAAMATAGEEFLRWRQQNPMAMPHIRQSTWGVPRTWFVMVVEDERETYDADRFRSVRYRARIIDARRRLAAAYRLLRSAIDDVDLLEEMSGLGDWLESFDPTSWVELDYAGIAGFLRDQLTSDQSARDIHRALDALRRDDLATAGEAYRAFEERWRAVNAYERAN